MNPLSSFIDIPTPVWVAVSGALSGVGTWIISMRQISVTVERARLKMREDALAEENAERAAFRATLIADVSTLRTLVKDCEIDRNSLRTRINTAEEQILVLKASNEIMERWLAFFKDRNAMDTRGSAGPARPESASANTASPNATGREIRKSSAR